MGAEQVFKAVADQHRRQLLDALAQRDGQTLGELCAGMPMSRIGVMKHLDILEEAGLIATRKVGREKLHFLNSAPLHDIASWLENYRRRWDDSMDRLEEIIDRKLQEQQAKEQKDE